MDDHLFYAQLSLRAYESNITEMGYTIQYFEKDHTELFLLENSTHQIIVFRGSDDFKDWVIDSHWTFTDGVHSGFLQYAYTAYSLIHAKINSKPLVLTGHSLGGAICVAFASLLQKPNVTIYTYGCPKVGSAKFVKSLTIPHYRWVNCFDYITLLPVWPFQHHGTLMYIDSNGVYRNINLLGRIWDKLISYPFKNNHKIDYYVEYLSRIGK